MTSFELYQTTHSSSLRSELEQLILGACLLEASAYLKVADVLTPNNFSKPDLEKLLFIDHQLVWATFQKLYPARPIDAKTVSMESKIDGYYLCEYMSKVSSTANLRYHAFCLLEMNLRDAFIKLITSLISTNTSTLVRVCLGEILDEALDGDVFEILPSSITYLKKIGAESEAEKIQNFEAQLDKRILNIKQQAHIDALMANLERLSTAAGDLNAELSLQHLTTLIKNILVTGKVSTEKMNKILAL